MFHIAFLLVNSTFPHIIQKSHKGQRYFIGVSIMIRMMLQLSDFIDIGVWAYFINSWYEILDM